jgi:hypothetical protein
MARGNPVRKTRVGIAFFATIVVATMNCGPNIWIQIDGDHWHYLAGHEKKTIAAEIRKCDRAKWQIAIRGGDGVMAVLPGFCERLSIAQRAIEARLRSSRRPEANAEARTAGAR